MALTSLERDFLQRLSTEPWVSLPLFDHNFSRPPGGSRLRANWDVADGVGAVRNHRDRARCHCRRLICQAPTGG
jgi:hypothetical protein